MSFRIDPTKNSALAFLLGAALVGGVLGFTADRYVTRDRVCPRYGDDAAMRRRFGDDLGLSDAQRAAVDTILNAKHRAIAELDRPVGRRWTRSARWPPRASGPGSSRASR
jgi:hypothetical protein